MPGKQQGGAKKGAKKAAPKVGDTRTLANGVRGEYRLNDNGKLVFRIVKADPKHPRKQATYMKDGKKVTGDAAALAARKARAAKPRKADRKLSQADAQKAFDKWYGSMTVTRGANKGKARFSSEKSRDRKKAYDLKYTDEKMVIDDVRYAHNPHRFEYRGVDTGPATRKQRGGARRQQGGKRQQGGYWW